MEAILSEKHISSPVFSSAHREQPLAVLQAGALSISQTSHGLGFLLSSLACSATSLAAASCFTLEHSKMTAGVRGQWLGLQE